AVIRQATHVRVYQIGPYAAEATRILNEISQARVTLLDPTKRAAYDAELSPKVATTAGQVTAPPLRPLRPADEISANLNELELASPPRHDELEPSRVAIRSRVTILYIGLATVLFFLFVLLFILVFTFRGRPFSKDTVAQDPGKEDRDHDKKGFSEK